MKRSDLAYIERALANLRPDMRTAPVICHDEWRRVVRGLGEAFSISSFAHLYSTEEWLNGTGADTREPAPREGEPYEQDGAWYNLTESEAAAQGLIPDPAAPRWLVPRNLDAHGNPVVDPENAQIIDAVTGEWRDMTENERARWPAPVAADPADYADAREHPDRRDYCRHVDPQGMFYCTRPAGHAGLHAAMSEAGALFRTPWGGVQPVAPQRARPRLTLRECGDEYEDDDGNVHVCTERRGHDDETCDQYDPDIDHSDGDITW